MTSEYHYRAQIRWTGAGQEGTLGYDTYGRQHEIVLDDCLLIPATSDPAFRGARDRANPEQLLVAAISSCHMLWYLHLCSQAHIVVRAYEDDASGVMKTDRDGAGRFERVDLAPRIVLDNPGDEKAANALHQAAHKKCFIANSVNFEIMVAARFVDRL